MMNTQRGEGRGRQVLSRRVVERLYRSTVIQRWTDHARPASLTVTGKTGQQMALAWLLGHSVESDDFDWIWLIEAGLFELLRKCVLTDIKSQVFQRMVRDTDARDDLNEFVLAELKPELGDLGIGMYERMTEFLEYEGEYYQAVAKGSAADSKIEFTVLRAASLLATRWEYELLAPTNPNVFENIGSQLERDVEHFAPTIASVDEQILQSFTSLLGQLRLQERWSQTPILPTRSVMDHEMMVGALAYLTVTEDHRDANQRRYNAFFGGLFHDFPEALTRDIVSPVKRISEKVEMAISRYEGEQLDKTVPLILPARLHDEFKCFTVGEFKEKAWPMPELSDGSNHYDGSVIKSCDLFAAFMEAYYSIRFGVGSPDLRDAILYMFERRQQYSRKFEVPYELFYWEIEPQLRLL